MTASSHTFGTLFLIPTPIAANTESIPLPDSTLSVARGITHFIAENEKSARAFLATIKHPVPLQQIKISRFDERTPEDAIPALFSPLAEGHDIGLVSEAGCPCIADPGAALVREAHRRGVRVAPLIGPSAILLALMASGLQGQSFWFVGYLPPRDPDRQTRISYLEQFSRSQRTTISCIETPYRSSTLLDALVKALDPATLLSVAVKLGAADQYVLTQPVSVWRESREEAARVADKPAVFSFLSRAQNRPVHSRPAHSRPRRKGSARRDQAAR